MVGALTGAANYISRMYEREAGWYWSDPPVRPEGRQPGRAELEGDQLSPP